MSVPAAILLFAVVVAASIIKKGAEVALEKEYGNWAPAVARLLIKAACAVCSVGELVQHGLLDERETEGQSFGISSPMGTPRVMRRGTFNLTGFGRSLLDRMTVLGSVEEDISKTECSAVPDTDACLVCGPPATHHIPRSSAWLERPDPADPTGVILEPSPPMSLCDSHAKSLGSGRLAVGWCEACGRWGEVNRVSGCGASFKALWGLLRGLAMDLGHGPQRRS
jgi:hypothetical protein